MVSAVSCATKRRCSSRPTRARYSPNVICFALVRRSASLARTSLFLGMTRTPIAAITKTPIHSTCPPTWRLSAPAMVRRTPWVTPFHASIRRLARWTPTAIMIGSSVYMWMVANRVCVQSVRACPFCLGRCCLHLSSSGRLSLIQSRQVGEGSREKADASAASKSLSVHSTMALLKRWAMLLDANDPNPSRCSDTKTS